MLKPDSDRVDYGEELYPPEGYVLSSAVGCTYSLDLDVLVSIPVSLALSSEMDFDKQKGKLQILDGLIKTMDKINVYCQKGKIKVPSNELSLYSLLENSIYQVLPKKNSSFHPKLWVIRYEDKKKKKAPKYKILILSRNLTSDRSYDISLIIDGEVTSQNRQENKEICDFISYLNKKQEFNNSKVFIRDLKKVEFSLEGSNIDEFEFIPIIEGKYDSDLLTKECDDLLIVSPFLSNRRLEKLYNISKVKPKLFSRKSELMKMNQQTISLFDSYHLKDEIVDGERILDNENEDEIKQQDIHSKIYVKDIGKRTELYLGSANCSHRAFENNIEFLVKLVMNKKYYNVDKAYEDLTKLDKEISLFTKFSESTVEIDPKKDKIEKILDKVEEVVYNLNLTGEVKEGTNNNYLIEIINIDGLEEIKNFNDISITIRPLTLKNKVINLDSEMYFDDISIKDITTFFIISITYLGLDDKNTDNIRELILKIDLNNIPSERNGEIIKGIINNRRTLLNYISFLLGEASPLELVKLIDKEGHIEESNKCDSSSFIKRAMFEKLLKATSRDTARIREVKYIIDLLGDDPIVPEDFREMFKAFENYE